MKALNFILPGCLSLGLLAEPAFAENDVVLHESISHSFQGPPNDGAQPMARLIRVHRDFYGTTFSGGAHKSGTAFKMTKEGVVTVLHSFGSGNDGFSPQAGLLDGGGVLYGTTSYSPVAGNCSYPRFLTGCGTVFKITTAGVERVVHHFEGAPDGATPAADLILVDDTLYGTTSQGGTGICGGPDPQDTYGCGTVFKMTKEGALTVLYSFQGASGDGATPVAGLINVGGTLYGTTSQGGKGSGTSPTRGCGTVFEITTAGVETMLHAFKGNGKDGCGPRAGLVDVGGVLYGTTYGGGLFGYGTVFKMTPDGVETVLHSFKGGIDGANPASGLLDVRGVLYGTTSSGGTGKCAGGPYTGCGTVFKITMEGITTVLHSFKGDGDGVDPLASLINVGDALYGTTFAGGTGAGTYCTGCGTVFKLAP